MRQLVSLVAVCALMLGLAASLPALLAVAQEGSPEAGTPAASPAASPVASPDAGAAASVTVELLDIYFEPEEITIPADTDVTFVLPNNGAALHTFDIDELDAHSGDVPPGETVEIVINAPAGTYEFYCNIPGHRAAGMVGTLIVE